MQIELLLFKYVSIGLGLDHWLVHFACLTSAHTFNVASVSLLFFFDFLLRLIVLSSMKFVIDENIKTICGNCKNEEE